ncbi:MAG TPA: TIGR03118 family protein [Candidatus Limnocylindrales bacterium]|nr:TIGR03118 family protein [Candidatus Limnocylindrales bacterium]
MKSNTKKVISFGFIHALHRWSACASAILLTLVALSAFGKDGDHGQGNDNEGDRNRGNSDDYQVVNLVSDQAGVAMLQDTNLVNAWGISFGATSPFWVSANGTGKALLYSVTNDDHGMVVVTKLGLEVTIPGEGNPTGQVFNNIGGFNGDAFLFVSEDGTISGWRQSLGTTAEVLTNRSGAVYKGVTLAQTMNGPVLLAANFSEATVDVYDTNSALVAQFTDQNAPAGYAPFNVQNLDGLVFVTFAKQDADKKDDVKGPGHGLIDLLNPNTGSFQRLVTGSDAGGRLDAINSPWGLVIAPSSFGRHADQLLVGNFGSGTIMSFDDRGKFRGLLEGVDEQPLVIEGLWALRVGNGGRGGNPDTLYFSAGPDDESHGLFGSISLVPEKHHRHHD